MVYFGYQCLPFVSSKIKCRSPNLPPIQTFDKIDKHRTRDFKLQNKMAGQSQEQKAWILKDFTKSQSIFLDYFTLNQSQYVRYD